MQSTKCLPRTGGRIFKKAPVTNHISASGTRVQFCVERWEAVMGSISHFRSGTRVQFCVERRKAVMGSISLPCAQRWATSCHLFRSGGKTEQRSQLFRNKVLASDSAGAWQQCACVCARARVCVCVLRCSVVSHSLQLHELPPTRLLRPWDSPGKNPGAGCHALLQGIFPTQGLHPRLLHWQAGSSLLGPLGSPWLQREVPVMTRRDSVCPGQSPGADGALRDRQRLQPRRAKAALRQQD